MLPLLFVLFIGSLQPRVAFNCNQYPTTGPTCTLISTDPETGAHTYECTTLGEGDCTYYVGTLGTECRCYEFHPHFQQILCPWNDCQGGQCKTCNLDKPGTVPGTWGKVKGLYR